MLSSEESEVETGQSAIREWLHVFRKYPASAIVVSAVMLIPLMQLKFKDILELLRS